MAATSTQACAFDGCENPAERGGLCWGHLKQRQLGQQLHQLVDRPTTPLDRLRRASEARENADEDEDYELADDNLRQAAKAYGRRSFSEAVQEGMERAKAAGVRLGRPATVDDHRVAEVVKSVGGIKRAARLLQVSRGTIRRALLRVRAARFKPGGP